MKHTFTLLTFLLIFTSITFAQKTVNAIDIIKDLKNGKNISYKEVTIIGVLDFTFMDEKLPNLPKKRKLWNKGKSNSVENLIKNNISFTNCTFDDHVLAYIPHEESGYTFIANFNNDVVFKNCLFNKKAMFKYSKFKGNGDFSKSNFKDDTTFKYTKFYKNISFENTLFSESATFKYTEFKTNVSFANSVFKESTTFKYTKFKKGVSFNSTRFEEDLNIKYTVVKGEFDIKNMSVAYDIDSKYTSINGQGFNKYLLKNN